MTCQEAVPDFLALEPIATYHNNGAGEKENLVFRVGPTSYGIVWNTWYMIASRYIGVE